MDPLDALAAINRLVAAILRLTEALAAPPAALAASLARQLQYRLDRLGAELLHVGIRIYAAPKPPREPSGREANPPSAERPSPSRPSARLPRRPGWLLDALPETAPAIADEIRAALQDPAMAALLAQDPATRRRLQPLCRMLGLDLASFLPTAPPADWLPLPYSRAELPARPGAAPPHRAPHPTEGLPPPREIAVS